MFTEVGNCEHVSLVLLSASYHTRLAVETVGWQDWNFWSDCCLSRIECCDSSLKKNTLFGLLQVQFIVNSNKEHNIRKLTYHQVAVPFVKTANQSSSATPNSERVLVHLHSHCKLSSLTFGIMAT